MRDTIVSALFLWLILPVSAQTIPTGWKILKDAKGACQIAVPPEWTPFAEGAGAAVFHDPSTAIAVVTSQPGQVYKPLTEVQLKTLEVPKEKIFENSAVRLFYQDRTAESADDSSAYSSMTPGKGGTCSSHIVFGRGVAEEIGKKIALSLGAAERPPS